MDVEMKIRGLVMDPATNMPIVILKDVKSDTVLPIWVGMYEANAIALEIEKSTTPRPMTHDLLKNLIRGLNAAVQKIVVTELKNDTFYAVIWMEQDGEVVCAGCPSFRCSGSGPALRLSDLRERGGNPHSQASPQHGGDHARGTATLAGGSERRRSWTVQDVEGCLSGNHLEDKVKA